ncbi:redoxin domain-containing protein [Pedobacter sp. AW31-3R]|uniref:redoxin domain-containing protein n=1 Tax=Pedobacter sp. AW31-3R TaxID=3445781 RepID=UPI003FA073AE
MKKIIILSLILFAIISEGKAQHTYTIDGQLGSDKQGFIILDYYKNGVYMRDSAQVHNGKFKFRGTYIDPIYATLDLNPNHNYVTPDKVKPADQAKFFIDGPMKVNSNSELKESSIKGGKTQADYLVRDASYKPLNAKLAILSEEMRPLYKDKNVEAMKPIQAQIGELLKQAQKIDSAFIHEHPDSYVAFDIWRSKHIKSTVKPEWSNEFDRFSKGIRSTQEGSLMAEKIARAHQLVTNKTAPPFTLKDLSDKNVSLSDFKGKNVLLIFWFRQFIPFETFSLYARRTQKRLKDKNTVMLGISYDDQEAWRGMAMSEFPGWIHLNAAKEKISPTVMGPTATAYGIYSYAHLPSAYFIGPDGKFLTDRINLNDNELGLKLEKLVK